MTIYTFAVVTTPDEPDSDTHILKLAHADDDPNDHTHAVCGIPGELGWEHTDRPVTCLECLRAAADLLAQRDI